MKRFVLCRLHCTPHHTMRGRQQRRIRAIAEASTSICYAVKMHKNPETGIYLNLCRYNVILHYPKK